jgi:hypothetical protein
LYSIILNPGNQEIIMRKKVGLGLNFYAEKQREFEKYREKTGKKPGTFSDEQRKQLKIMFDKNRGLSVA